MDGGACFTLADLLSTLQDSASYQPNLQLLAEMPLIREDSESHITACVPVVQMHIGADAEEVWLLLAPPAEFPPNSLPS